MFWYSSSICGPCPFDSLDRFPLGSIRAATDPTGHVCFDADYYPYGQEVPYNTSCEPEFKFAGMEYDSETGNHYDYARYYNPRLGRFMTPDPSSAGAVAGNPQSWNAYSYVVNNPETFIDPLGRQTCSVSTLLLSPGGAFGPVSTTVRNCTPSSTIPAALRSITLPVRVGKPNPDRQPQKQKGNILTCAASFGDKYSIAGGLHALGIGTSGIGGFITNALGGNAFSGATNLVASFGSGSAGGHNVIYNMALSAAQGPSQGVVRGLPGPWGSSASDLAAGAIAGTAWSSVTGAGQTLTTLGGEASLASTGITAAEFASGVAEVKYGYDALSYAAGLFACASR